MQTCGSSVSTTIEAPLMLRRHSALLLLCRLSRYQSVVIDRHVLLILLFVLSRESIQSVRRSGITEGKSQKRFHSTDGGNLNSASPIQPHLPIKCVGCGSLFQVEDPDAPGYIPPEKLQPSSSDETSEPQPDHQTAHKPLICQRCYKMRYYSVSIPGNLKFIRQADP